MEKVIQVEGIDKSELRELIKEVVLECLNNKPIYEPKNDKIPPHAVSTKKIAKLLDKCVATIHNYKKKKIIPFKKLGNRLYFIPEDVFAAMRTFEHKKSDNEYFFNN